jgi:diguanylate cyclase (GGDEF)-like protein/hemerythrin-like metal-binding protein/PAS domain S-box-containing protein
MQFFYWNKSFELDIPEVDLQHRRLVDLINALSVAFTEGGKLPDVKAVFGQLMEYAAEHFRDEELIIDASALSKAEKARHRKAHRDFVSKAREITGRADLLDTSVAEQVLEFLTTWLISHILGTDKKYAEAGTVEGKHRDSVFDISPVERVLVGALSETERRFRLISDHAPALIWVSDAVGTRGYFNRVWANFVGISEDAAQEPDWASFLHPDDLAPYLEATRALVDHPQPAELEYRLRKYTGDYHWVLERILPRMDTSGLLMGFVGSATDISTIKQAEIVLEQARKEMETEVNRRTAYLEQLILTDPLTGVGNRRFLDTRINEEVIRAKRYGHPLTAAFFDVDHFKSINDVHGHQVGDKVLSSVAACLKSCLRECDLLGRYGGEEFVVLLVETGIQDAMTITERMRLAVNGLTIAGIPERIGISAGLAELGPTDGPEELLTRSDGALYEAKGTGRNRCCMAS